MQRVEVMARAAPWMQLRGWKRKLAKKREYEQNLFEHSPIEVDVLFELLPILEEGQHYGLSESEQRVLAVAVLAHDAGKETDAWQGYLRGIGDYVPHSYPELTRQVLRELCDALGLGECGNLVQEMMAHCAESHVGKPGRSDGGILRKSLRSCVVDCKLRPLEEPRRYAVFPGSRVVEA